jgi:hypothetical protein
MQNSNQTSEQPERPKIAGLLLLIAVLLLLQFLRYLGQLETTLNPMEEGNIWRALKSLGGHPLQGLWHILLYYELFVQVAIAISSAIVALLLIGRHRLFPRLFQGFLLTQLILACGVWFLARQLDLDYAAQTLRTVIYYAVLLVLGIVYIHESERVKLTFSPQGATHEIRETTIF